MSKIFYKQCELENIQSHEKLLGIWIPAVFAEKNRIVSKKNLEGEWQSDWYVKSVGLSSVGGDLIESTNFIWEPSVRI